MNSQESFENSVTHENSKSIEQNIDDLSEEQLKEKWLVLNNQLKKEASKEAKEDLDISNYYYGCLVTELDDRLLKIKDLDASINNPPVDWRDPMFIARLDQSVYFSPAFKTSTGTLIKPIIENIQENSKEKMFTAGIERIEGETLTPRVLERDREVYEPTDDLSLNDKVCRIEPGKGGYRWRGNVLEPTFAVVYKYISK